MFQGWLNLENILYLTKLAEELVKILKSKLMRHLGNYNFPAFVSVLVSFDPLPALERHSNEVSVIKLVLDSKDVTIHFFGGGHDVTIA